MAPSRSKGSTSPQTPSIDLTAGVRATGGTLDFAQLLSPADDNAGRLQEWLNTAEEVNLPHVHSFIRGLRLGQDAVHAALTSEYHDGGTEGVNTTTKLIKRQMYGRAGFRPTPPHTPRMTSPFVTTKERQSR